MSRAWQSIRHRTMKIVERSRYSASSSSHSRFHTFGEVAQCLAVCAVRNLMSHHHEDRQWPFDDLDDCHHRDADIPAKARMRKLGHRSRMPRRWNVLASELIDPSLQTALRR